MRLFARKSLFFGLLMMAAVMACDDAVAPRVPSFVVVDPPVAILEVGDTVRLTAKVVDQDGDPMGSESITWQSSDEGVAEVDADGIVTAVSDGVTTISASSGALNLGAEVTVHGPPVADVATATPHEAGPMMRTLHVEVEGSELVEVTYWTDASPPLRVVSDEPDTQHSLTLARLIPDSEYRYSARTITPEGVPGEALTGTFISDTLPAGLRTVRFSARGESSHLTMLELRSQDWNGYVILDQDGSIVWHWETAGNPQGSTRRENGNFAFVDLGRGLIEVAIDGSIVNEVTGPMDPLTIHHEVITTSDNTLMFLTLDDEEIVNDTLWVGDRIWEWEPEAGATAELRWSTFDAYDIVADRAPRSRPSDWGHANSLSIGLRGNVLVSFNFLNQVASITPDSGELEWRLGGIGSDFELDFDDPFSGQHTAAEVSEGRVLMFDNGFDRGGTDEEFSRGIELALDQDAGVATVAWEFRPYPDNFASIISSARRLENGNTLVHFGTAVPLFGASSGGPIETFEVTEGGEVVWHLRLSATQSVYRANPVTSIAGEMVVED